ncbi:MAG: WYL domain-containing protein [Bacteroidales bacterium]|nr:WYL domain-containing protein [Bacteroidales bacterium]
MARNKIAILIWIVDTIESHNGITLGELNRRWCNSSLSDGNPMPRRTFFNYRNAIEEMFNINIQCNRSTYEYYIDNSANEAESRMHRWLLDSFSMTGMLSDSRDLSGRIIVEDVPSARDHLPVVIQAMRDDKRITFDYRNYTRSQPSVGVVICPYFVKIFRQRWYVIGHNVTDGKIKTYALDRMSNLAITDVSFQMPPTFDPEAFFQHSFGIITNQSEPKDIKLRVSYTQAKYFRARPLHSSQKEEVHDSYSIFTYRMLLTYDLYEEILSHGSDVEVQAPPELKAHIVKTLKEALEHYKQGGRRERKEKEAREQKVGKKRQVF